MTFDVSKIASHYNSNKRTYEDACEEVTYALKAELDARRIKWHSVTARVKSLDSVLEKVERKQYEDPFEQVEDIAGIRVVCLFMADLKSVDEIISSIFRVESKEDTVNPGEAADFGYMSQHFVCRLSDAQKGPRYNHIQGIKFEIQVRTILMDAWATVSHYLTYKNEESVPRDLLRDFHALSGLLYVADRQFESLSIASSMSAAKAEYDILYSDSVGAYEVNADTIAALLRREFPERKQFGANGISALTAEIREAGIEDLEEISSALHSTAPIVLAYESQVLLKKRQAALEAKGQAGVSVNAEVPGTASGGLLRMALTLTNERFREVMRKKFETKHSKEVEALLEFAESFTSER